MYGKVFHKKRAYSIAEIVISMALILIMTAAGFTVCYIGLNLQKTSQGRLQLRNLADNIRISFETSLQNTGGVSSEDENKKAFLLDFNNRLAFTVNSWSPALKDFTGDRRLEGEGWEIHVALEEETYFEGNQEKNRTVRGLDLRYPGADGVGATYTFFYKYFTNSYSVDIIINVRTGSYYLTVNGYLGNAASPACELAEIYS